MVLVENGQARCSVVLPKDATGTEQHAAKELRRYVSQITGANLPLRHEPNADLSSIFIGGAADQASPSAGNIGDLGFDGYYLSLANGDFHLSGARH